MLVNLIIHLHENKFNSWKRSLCLGLTYEFTKTSKFEQNYYRMGKQPHNKILRSHSCKKTDIFHHFMQFFLQNLLIAYNTSHTFLLKKNTFK